MTNFYDPAAIDAELRRVFDVCHGCRRCFNLCDSFPRLFDLVDASKTGELDAVDSEDFKPVVDACTLCDMCFMTKCPYVPPHEFNLDFPHLMLRYRAMEAQAGQDRLRRPAAGRDRSQRQAGGAGRADGQLGDATRQHADAADAGEGGRHRIRDAELPKYARQDASPRAPSRRRPR